MYMALYVTLCILEYCLCNLFKIVSVVLARKVETTVEEKHNVREAKQYRVHLQLGSTLWRGRQVYTLQNNLIISPLMLVLFVTEFSRIPFWRS